MKHISDKNTILNGKGLIKSQSGSCGFDLFKGCIFRYQHINRITDKVGQQKYEKRYYKSTTIICANRFTTYFIIKISYLLLSSEYLIFLLSSSSPAFAAGLDHHRQLHTQVQRGCWGSGGSREHILMKRSRSILHGPFTLLPNVYL